MFIVYVQICVVHMMMDMYCIYFAYVHIYICGCVYIYIYEYVNVNTYAVDRCTDIAFSYHFVILGK